MRVLITLLLFMASTALAEEKRTIVFFGDSLTAGYGLSPDESYPALIQKRVPPSYQIQNSGVSGDTTSDGLRRLKWALHNRPEIFVLALGANDGLRGLDPELIERNLREIIRLVRESWPQTTILLVGMELPTNLGDDYRQRFREIFPRLAQELHLPFVPFLLQGVAGVAELNQADGLHPTAEGQRIIEENIWKILEPLLLSSQSPT